jgi:hypothetical protein
MTHGMVYHQYTNSADLEVGPINISQKVKNVVDLYKRHESRIKYIIFSSLVVTTAMILKYASYNVDTVIEAATAITFDEKTYEPFSMTPELITSLSSEQRAVSRDFPIKGSQVNWKMQTINIVQARNVVWEYLDVAKQECIHLRHFGVPYDIIIFKNVTMVNPSVLAESDERIKVKEMALDGTVSRKSRPTWIKVGYYTEALTYQVETIWGTQSYCFAHYEFN